MTRFKCVRIPDVNLRETFIPLGCVSQDCWDFFFSCLVFFCFFQVLCGQEALFLESEKTEPTVGYLRTQRGAYQEQCLQLPVQCWSGWAALPPRMPLHQGPLPSRLLGHAGKCITWGLKSQAEK